MPPPRQKFRFQLLEVNVFLWGLVVHRISYNNLFKSSCCYLWRSVAAETHQDKDHSIVESNVFYFILIFDCVRLIALYCVCNSKCFGLAVSLDSYFMVYWSPLSIGVSEHPYSQGYIVWVNEPGALLLLCRTHCKCFAH